MAIDLQEVKGFVSYAKKLTVLIKDHGVTEAILKNYLHNCGCKVVPLAFVIGSMAANMHMLQHAVTR